MSIGIADVYTSSTQDETKAVELIRRALDLGINFLDTANIYGDSELKVGKALQGRRNGVVLATKFGIVTDSPVQNRGVDGTPANARRACDLSLKRLGVDRIDLYYLHRVDPQVPIEENSRAIDVQVDEKDLSQVERAFPHGAVRGKRYTPEMMKIINS